MKNYKLINNISGWVAFLVAAVTYILTIEPTTSFWDCGEFITSAFKLEVGHPPGAPLFMMIGHLFSIFAFGDVTKVALMINIMSALSSAFTILFLFWTITHIARRILVKSETELDLAQTIIIMGTGLVGALAYTFSDTFWFSAVEGEVYAMSSLFTAVVFWLILKWESEADQKYANRWIILIAYMMGLSIGVHLLNLLAIPAIVFVYYFKKYEINKRGILAALGVSVAILIGIMYIIIPGTYWLASRFELIFTNSFGLPYNTGTFVYLVLLSGALAFGIWYTDKKKKIILNTIILGVTVILIGYSSFALIIIRATANTPMNQNKPDNVFALQSYLNREQYGDRPLVTGQYFNAPVINYENGKPSYIKRDGKYVIVDYSIERKFDSKYTTIFPRMYSDQENHSQGYAQWAGLKDLQRVPSFGENLAYFFKYQVNFMYWRYFMWNFSGRQSDIQGHGNNIDGNWISGIPFIDELRLGSTEKQPDYLKNNPAKNKYYMLPFILGLIGAVFIYRRNKIANKYFWSVMLFFILTGLAIIVYLNQPPFQPRERDYAYAGSFYAFSIYIGFGVLGLYELLKKYLSPVICAGAVTGVTFLTVPVLMAAQNWDDHDRSERYTARDFAYNYLTSCPPNAILFTNGDNDTFPLWYAQEVEGYRTDVRVINLSYLNTDWYIDQAKRKVYNSEAVPFQLTHDKYVEGTRDIIYVNENPSVLLYEKYVGNKTELEPEFKALFEEFYSILSASLFKTEQAGDFEKFGKGYAAFSPMQLNGMANKLAQQQSIDKFKINSEQIISLKNRTNAFMRKISEQPVLLKDLITFITSDSPENKVNAGGEEMNYIPCKKVKIPINKKDIIDNKIVSEKDASQIVSAIEWTINKKYIRKSELMVLDLLAANNWKRPVCFAITVGGDNYIGLEEYFQLNGLAYQVVPVKSKGDYGVRGRIVADSLYNNLVTKFRWGGVDNPKVYLDENNSRMLLNLKHNYARLAEQYIKDNQKEKAIAVLDTCYKRIPKDKVPYNYYDILLSEQYYDAGATDKGMAIMKELAELTAREMEYYLSTPERFAGMLQDESQRSIAMAQEIIRQLRKNKQKELNEQYSARYAALMRTFMPVLMQVDRMQSNEQEFFQWYQALPDENKQLISLYIYFLDPNQESN